MANQPDPNILTGLPGAAAVVSPQGGMQYPVMAPADPTGKLAMGCTTLLTLPSAAYGTASTANPSIFSTTYINSLAVDINITAVTGGVSPGYSYLFDRQGADGVWYNVFTTANGTAIPAQYSIDTGNFSVAFTTSNTAQHCVLTNQARMRWVYAGTPTSFTFSMSVIGR